MTLPPCFSGGTFPSIIHCVGAGPWTQSFGTAIANCLACWVYCSGDSLCVSIKYMCNAFPGPPYTYDRVAFCTDLGCGPVVNGGTIHMVAAALPRCNGAVLNACSSNYDVVVSW